MNHVEQLRQNKEYVELRAYLTRLVREFFWSRGFLEVETPQIIKLPGQEPYLSPMKLNIHDEKGQEFPAYLHTSPEYTMKKMLAAGFARIFSLGKVFRDYESFGGRHNPEFTLIEWYRAQEDFWKIMEDVEELFKCIQEKLEIRNLKLETNSKIENFDRVHMRALWREQAGINLDDYLDQASMYELGRARGYEVKPDEPYEDLFYRIFLNEIEPKLTAPTIIHHYPAPMAALAKLSETEPEYAERFEVYVNGVELANAFTELTDADEQRRRLQAEQEQRRKFGKDVYDIDPEFIAAVRQLPPCAGIALGVDRLAQILVGCKNIDDVIGLSASRLFTPDI